MTAPALTLEQRVARIEAVLGIGPAPTLHPVPWSLRGPLVVHEAARLWNVTIEELKGPLRLQHLTTARAGIVLALRWHPPMSYAGIGRLLGKDHSSIINLERIGHIHAEAHLAFAARVRELQRLIGSAPVEQQS